MALLFSVSINLNPELVARHEFKDPKFEAFNNKELHLIPVLNHLISIRFKKVQLI